MPEIPLPPQIREHIEKSITQRKQARILSHAQFILRGWVAMTPNAPPAFVASHKDAALAVAAELERVDIEMRVPESESEPDPEPEPNE